MNKSDKTIVTCAVTGVLTSPEKFNVPVTPEQMADATEQAYNQGASAYSFSVSATGYGGFPLMGFERGRRYRLGYKRKGAGYYYLYEYGGYGE